MSAINFNPEGVLINNETVINAPYNEDFELSHNLFSSVDFQIKVGDTVLTPQTDYILTNRYERAATEMGLYNIYQRVRILNNTYSGSTLSIRYRAVGDFVDADKMQDQAGYDEHYLRRSLNLEDCLNKQEALGNLESSAYETTDTSNFGYDSQNNESLSDVQVQTNWGGGIPMKVPFKEFAEEAVAVSKALLKDDALYSLENKSNAVANLALGADEVSAIADTTKILGYSPLQTTGAGGGKISLSTIWTWIKGKIADVLGLSENNGTKTFSGEAATANGITKKTDTDADSLFVSSLEGGITSALCTSGVPVANSPFWVITSMSNNGVDRIQLAISYGSDTAGIKIYKRYMRFSGSVPYTESWVKMFPVDEAAKVTNAITFSNSGNGAASGSTFDGSAARTLSYNSIGAAAAKDVYSFTYVVDSDQKLADWANNVTSNGQDYTSVLIKKGTYSARCDRDGANGINLTQSGTKVIVGETGSVITMHNDTVDTTNTTKVYFSYDNVPDGVDYLIYNVTLNYNSRYYASPYPANYAFKNCRSIKKCKVTNISSSNHRGLGRSFYGCYDIEDCEAIEADNADGSFTNCFLVKKCKANKQFVSSFSSPTAITGYECANTLEGGWNTVN
jgi:hypothetical protein